MGRRCYGFMVLWEPDIVGMRWTVVWVLIIVGLHSIC